MAFPDIKLLIKTVGDKTGLNIVLRGTGKLLKIVFRVGKAFAVMGRLGSKALGLLRRGTSMVTPLLNKLRTAAIATTIAIGALIRNASKYTIQMARASTMMNGGVREFNKFRKEVNALSGDLGVLKSELADGLYETLSRGIPQDNALDFLKLAAKVAVADSSTVSGAVAGMTNILNAFHLESAQAMEVADQLFSTVANGATTFAALAANIATVAPAAAAANIPIQQILAAIATMTKGGTPTAQAMTQIRASIFGLNKVLGDGWIKTMSFQDAMAKVAKQAGGSQTALKKLLGTDEALMGVLGLTGKNARQAADDLAQMAGSAGALQGAFDKMDRVRHWPKFWQTVVGIATRLGIVLDETVAPVINSITKELAKWRDTDKIFDGLRDKLEGFREDAADFWEAILGGGREEVENIFDGIKDILIGMAVLAAQAAARTLFAVAGEIGTAIGAAIKTEFLGFIEDKAIRSVAKDMAAQTGRSVDEEERRTRAAIGKEKQSRFDRALGGSGQGRIDKGLATLENVRQFGAASRAASDVQGDLDARIKADAEKEAAVALERQKKIQVEILALTKQINATNSAVAASRLIGLRAQARSRGAPDDRTRIVVEERKALMEELQRIAFERQGSIVGKEEADVAAMLDRLSGAKRGQLGRAGLQSRLGREEGEAASARSAQSKIAAGDPQAIHQALGLSADALEEMVDVIRSLATMLDEAREEVKIVKSQFRKSDRAS